MATNKRARRERPRPRRSGSREIGFAKVKVAVSDIDGVLRGKVCTGQFLSALDGGFGFCDVVFGWT